MKKRGKLAGREKSKVKFDMGIDKNISRRRFIAGTVIAGSGVVLSAELNSITSGKLFPFIGKLVTEVPDIIKAKLVSREDHSQEYLESTASIEDIDDGAYLTVKRPRLVFSDGKRRWTHEPLLVFFKPVVRCSLKPITNGMREKAIDSESSQVFLGPIGNVTGDYDRDLIDPGRNLGTLFASRVSENVVYGPEQITDRFPGMDEEINRSSGGVIVKDGRIIIADKNELLTEQISGSSPFFQSIYYFDQKNVLEVLQNSWQVHEEKFRLGNTHYFYAAYFQIPLGGQLCTGFIVNDKETMALANVVKTVAGLSDDGSFKMALVDGGNGSSAFVRKSDGTVAVFGRNGADDHLIPFTVRVGS